MSSYSLMRVQRRISKGMEVLEYYTTNQWDFKSDKLQLLRKKLNEREYKTYKLDADGNYYCFYYYICLFHTAGSIHWSIHLT